mmetsp:Transcript_103764/g.302877  ORF Transcript_103764/g.302877 Transcript_103764/m.302877 type:complete len:224 (+) Transcript_103764:270-941(+)
MPISGSALTAATRTRVSSSNMRRQTSAAYIWPISPHAATVAMAWTRTRPTGSPRRLTKSSTSQPTPSSPMRARPPREAARSTGSGLFIISDILPMAAGPHGFPVLSAKLPKASQMAWAWQGEAPVKQPAMRSSNLEPASPHLPKAVMHATRTSQSSAIRPSDSLSEMSAARTPLLPRLPRAAAAAHAGFRSTAGGLRWRLAAHIARAEVSSAESAKRSSRASM